MSDQTMKLWKRVSITLACIWIIWGIVGWQVTMLLFRRYGLTMRSLVSEPMHQWSMLTALMYTAILPILGGVFLLAGKRWPIMVASAIGLYWWTGAYYHGGHHSPQILCLMALDVVTFVVMIVVKMPNNHDKSFPKDQ